MSLNWACIPVHWRRTSLLVALACLVKVGLAQPGPNPDRNVAGYTSTFQTLTFGSTITWDQTKGATSAVTLTGNGALSITNAVAGMYGLIRVTQDATGSRTLTLPGSSKVINEGGGVVTLTTTGGATDVLSYFYDGSNYYWTVGYNYN